MSAPYSTKRPAFALLETVADAVTAWIRSGAAAGVAAILVPFPAAVDDHQSANARFLVRGGAAVVIADRELTPERLAAEIERLCADRARLLAMAESARALAQPAATEALAGACEGLVRRAA